MKYLSFLFLLTTVIACRLTKDVDKTTPHVLSINVSALYNSDSSYYVIEQVNSDLNGLPNKFYVVETSKTDTVYHSISQYAFQKWYAIDIIELKQVLGIDPDRVENKLDDRNTNDIFYLNIHSKEIKPQKPTTIQK